MLDMSLMATNANQVYLQLLLLLFGLVLSVILVGALATYFAKFIQDHKWVGYVGLAVILLVAVQLIIGGLMDYGVLTINEPFASWF